MAECSLIPINLNNEDEVQALQQHRIACGWDYDLASIALWKEKQEKNLKSFFWIVIPHSQIAGAKEVPEQEGVESTTTSTVRAGHISLDSYCHPADPDLASEDKTNLTIQTFFILPAYRAGGLGRRVMDLLESMTVEEPYGSPDCKFITLNTISKRYFYEDTPIAKFIQARASICNQEWYERRGYVAWKEEPRYDETMPDGSPVTLVAVFMRKDVAKLRPSS